MKKYLFLILAVALIAGCLSDTIIGPQIVSRPVLAPGQVFYKCITLNGVPTLNLLVSWNPSTVDTQQNFKGYFVELFQSAPYFNGSSDGIDSVYGTPDTAHVPKSDTMKLFINKVKQGQRYTVRVWGERFPNPVNDTIVKSLASSRLSFYFDSNPVLPPAEIYASSASSSSVNLFWTPSISSSNIGMAGYVIRYIDPNNNAAHVIYYSRPQKDTSVSQLIQGKYDHAIVAVPGNTNLNQPVEKEYVFWIKAIRQDSTESGDSIGIKWSGAERIPPTPLPVRLDTGVFMGQVNFVFNLVQVVPNDISQALPQFVVSQSGTNVLVTAKNGTSFVNHVDTNTSLTYSLDQNFFAAPFTDADFSTNQVLFANTGNDKGAIIYAKLSNNNRARIWFSKAVDSTHSNNSYIRTDNTIEIQASFQPQETPQLPFF